MVNYKCLYMMFNFLRRACYITGQNALYDQNALYENVYEIILNSLFLRTS